MEEARSQIVSPSAADEERRTAEHEPVTLTNVTKRFKTGGVDVTAVDDVSIRFEAGSMTALVGASGSGKSTLLHLIGGIDQPDTGSICVGSLEVTRLRRRTLLNYRRRVGFIFQRYHLLPVLTALDNVMAPLMAYRTDFDKEARAREMLDAVGLSGRELALPGQLSGGQQQRVAIARALVVHPTLLLADEPTGNLDSKTGQEILDLLVNVRERHQVTVLVATHERQIAQRCDRLIALRDGRITEEVDLLDAQAQRESISNLRV